MKVRPRTESSIDAHLVAKQAREQLELTSTRLLHVIMPKIPQFSLSIHSFTPPTLPERPVDAPASAFRSPLIPSTAAATLPLRFTVSLPTARETDSLYPATHLQLSYNFEGSGEVFIPDVITSKDLTKSESEAEPNLYEVETPAQNVPRPKVNEGAPSAAEVFLYAWRGEKLLGKWTVGRVEGLGIEGLKSDPLAILRRDTWAAKKAASSTP